MSKTKMDLNKLLLLNLTSKKLLLILSKETLKNKCKHFLEYELKGSDEKMNKWVN